mgnify:CR=1 FL=1|tara:strand:- start:585 stop:953 length:369 start_codon:yes stop_codon:yes gene_type:complete
MSDYNQMLKDMGVSEEQVQKVTNQHQVLEFDSKNYYKSKSKIHGDGVFASIDIKHKSIIGLATIDNVIKTTLGRFVNHSSVKNARFYILKNKDLVLVAEKDIPKYEEILVDYRDHTLHEKFL